MIERFVAMGDSFTQGIGDEVGGLPQRSAIDWLAHWLAKQHPGMQYTNLAHHGLRANEIREQQLAKALALNPDWISIIAGANDCLRGPFSPDALRAELNLMFGAFSHRKVQILSATLPNFTHHLPLPQAVAQRIYRNLQNANAVLSEVAQQHGVWLFDFWETALNHQPELWSQDGVHPNALGYLETAKRMAHALNLKVPA